LFLGQYQVQTTKYKTMNATLHHVNVTVPRAAEDAAKHFYGAVMGLPEVPKPAESLGRGGAWYQLGSVQLHLSIEDGLGKNCISKRHVCYTVSSLAEAEAKFREAGIEILPDDIPTAGWSRFYVRDPGGNRLEIAQAV
jgi:catechol 2,3-dioxygenase-like lactoylglutathione lyase family enzyme